MIGNYAVFECKTCGLVHLAGSTCTDAASTFLPKRYRVMASLGAGGFGSVWKAWDQHLDNAVAVKLLNPLYSGDADMMRRFVDEARAVAKIDHVNVVRVLDVSEFSGAPYLVMECLEGENCWARLQRVGPLIAAQAAHIVCEACSGLAEAHRKGIWHRDIKPGNLFLHRVGTAPEVTKVLDFGIAKLAEGSVHQSTRSGIVGTPAYMPPERLGAEGKVDGRVDVWALGIVLYELLGACLPFEGEHPASVIARVCSGEPTPITRVRTDLHPELVAVLNRALAKHPDDRIASVARLRELLLPFTGRDLSLLSRESERPPPSRAESRESRPSESRARQILRPLAFTTVGAIASLGVSQWLGHGAASEAPPRAESSASTSAARKSAASAPPEGRSSNLAVGPASSAESLSGIGETEQLRAEDSGTRPGTAVGGSAAPIARTEAQKREQVQNRGRNSARQGGSGVSKPSSPAPPASGSGQARVTSQPALPPVYEGPL